jgi:deoxyadenosine/deoxycytidine kinase
MMSEEPTSGPLIGIVGPCGAGKSTLLAGLEQEGFRCTHIAQEHSYVPAMWRRIANPDSLIFLEASFETCTRRRRLNWTQADYAEQLHRLRDARQHADLVVSTDALSADEVLRLVVANLRKRG